MCSRIYIIGMQNWPVTACICVQSILWKSYLTGIFYQSVGLKCTFLSKIRLLILWKTLILREHYATMLSYKFCKTLDSICNCICHFFLLIFVVAEDVSLTGGAAIQRIRLIDEEEQVWPNIITFSVVNSSGPESGLKRNLKSDMKA